MLSLHWARAGKWIAWLAFFVLAGCPDNPSGGNSSPPPPPPSNSATASVPTTGGSIAIAGKVIAAIAPGTLALASNVTVTLSPKSDPASLAASDITVTFALDQVLAGPDAGITVYFYPDATASALSSNRERPAGLIPGLALADIMAVVRDAQGVTKHVAAVTWDAAKGAYAVTLKGMALSVGALTSVGNVVLTNTAVPTVNLLLRLQNNSVNLYKWPEAAIDGSPKVTAAPADGLVPLILVHGIGCTLLDGGRLYKKTWEKFHANFYGDPDLKNKFALYTFQYPHDAGIRDNGRLLADRISKVFGTNPVVVVGHSMGGLVTRVADLASDDAVSPINTNISRVITLNTPHLGVPVADDAARLLSTTCLFQDQYGAKDLAWHTMNDGVNCANPFLCDPTTGLNAPGNLQHLKKYVLYSGNFDLEAPSDISLKELLRAVCLSHVLYCPSRWIQILSQNNTFPASARSGGDGVVLVKSQRMQSFNGTTWDDRDLFLSMPDVYNDIDHSSIHDSENVFTKKPDGVTPGGIRQDLLNFHRDINPPPAAVPTVSSASWAPTSPAVGSAVTFTFAGTNLTSGYAFSLTGCAAVEASSASTTQRQFTCTPSVAGSALPLVLKTAAGVVLISRNVAVSAAPAAVPTVSSVGWLPASPVVGSPVTFTFTGTNLTSGYTFSLAGCAAVEVVSASTTQRQFTCTPSIAGGALPLVLKTAAGGVLTSANVAVSAAPAAVPRVNSVSWVPASVTVGVPVIFTLTGTNLDPQGAYTFSLTGCNGVSIVRASTTDWAFYCTPAIAGSGLPLVLKTAAGAVLISTNVAVTAAPAAVPTVNSVIWLPASPAVGSQVTFTATGTNLQPGYIFSLPGCNASEVSSSSTTQRQFTCTPTQAGLALAGEIRTGGSVLLKSFTVEILIASGPPTAAGRIAVGSYHSCGITGTGGVKCWGYNGWGQLGYASASFINPSPREVLDMTSGVVAVSAGDLHTCALTNVGGVKCWGAGTLGQLGDGTTRSYSTLPVNVRGMTRDVRAVSAGDSHTCALTSVGDVKCWGHNSSGQLGDGTTTDSFAPVSVMGLPSGVVAVSAGKAYTCALTGTGGVKCWGGNSSGQLGDGTGFGSRVPVNVTSLTSGVAAVSAGDTHACAFTTVGGVKCWGYNNSGELGNGTVVDSLVPVNVVGMPSGVVAISAGVFHTCALNNVGGVKCWGQNGGGQLGDGTTSFYSTLPVNVSGMPGGATAVSARRYHTCALTNVGGVKCWGYNDYGELGNGTTTDSRVPVNVLNFP